jgi:hypothetical protein
VKTQILQIEPHDDAISTRDKMGWSQTSRILLVWPARRRVLARRLDLVLLQRHSQALGAQLALVVSDPEVRYQASLLGISTFRSVKAAQKSRWKRPTSQLLSSRITGLEARSILSGARPVPAPRPLARSTRLSFFSLGVLAVLSIASVLFPSAEVRLDPATQVQQVSLSVRASESIERVNRSGLIPLSTWSVVVEGRDQIEPSGTAQVPDQAAHGEVVFTNLTDRPVTIPIGTEVSAGEAGVRYKTGREGRLAAGPGETLSLPASALRPGTSGNLAARRIQAILGPLSTELTVTNPAPIRGGTARTSPAPTRQDRDRLRERLLSTLQESAQEEIQTLLQAGDQLLNPDLTLAGTLEETFTPPGTEPAYLLDLSLRLEFHALVLAGEDLRSLAALVLDANLPQGYQPTGNEIEIDRLQLPEFPDSGGVQLVLQASREIRASLSQPQAASLALGLSPLQAATRLDAALPLDSPPEIALQPAWWPRMPILPLRITVVTDQ